MASTYSTLKVELIGTGEQTGTWGTTTNDNLSIALGEAITGSADVAFSSADVTVTLTDSNGAQTARNLRLNLTGTSGGARNLILGSGCQIEKLYLINNGLADAVTVKNTSGTGIAVAAGKSMFVFNNGTNVVDATTYLSSLTLGTPLVVASGGTGLATLTANNVLIGNGTSNVTFVAPGSTGNVLTSNGSTWTSAAASGFPSGTVMLFAQTAAPTGFTKNTTTGDNSALRVVTGTASTGGSVAFTTAFASQTPSGSVSVTGGSVGSTTLSTPQIPSHSHGITAVNDGGNGSNGLRLATSGINVSQPTSTNNAGGGGSHDHPFSGQSATFTGSAINLAVQYIDVIRATKD